MQSFMAMSRALGAPSFPGRDRRSSPHALTPLRSAGLEPDAGPAYESGLPVVDFPRTFAAFGLALAAPALAAACVGTTVLDAPDPKACASSHGCPMVACPCADGSIVLDTTCELGKCLGPESVCDDRCADFGGARETITTEGDEVAVPDCDTFCTRLAINGCELGCDTLFSVCKTPTTCDPLAAAFWQCATQEGVITCDDNAARIEGCGASAFGVCE